MHPDTTLHHSEETGRSVVGGTVDEERMKEVIGELTGVSSYASDYHRLARRVNSTDNSVH